MKIGEYALTVHEVDHATVEVGTELVMRFTITAHEIGRSTLGFENFDISYAINVIDDVSGVAFYTACVNIVYGLIIPIKNPFTISSEGVTTFTGGKWDGIKTLYERAFVKWVAKTIK